MRSTLIPEPNGGVTIPPFDLNRRYSEGLINRGVSTWADDRPGHRYARRIFIATIDARLICLDAATGHLCADFGFAGQVDLTRGIQNITRDGEYEETSPPAIIDGLVIVGSSVADNDRVASPAGLVRAFDARTGALRWSWNPITQNSRDPAARGWVGDASSKTGAANAWSVIAVDQARHIVYVPTGSVSPDYYGGERKGNSRWADSVVALQARSGKLVWGFQLVHHDLWDYDTASPPLLTTLVRDGVRAPVVIQGNKAGNLFVLDRVTGNPVFPVEERTVPRSDVPGEQASPTQPFPALPPLTPQRISPDDAWGVTSEEREACRERMKKLRNDGLFTPPSVSGSLVYPGNIGGMNWSGYAFDPSEQLLVTNTLRVPFEVHLIPRDRYPEAERVAKANEMRAEVSPQHGTPYGMSREPLLSPTRMIPCIAPPWSVLTAVDLSSGKIRWETPLGTTEGSLPSDPPLHGLAGFGGPIVTAGGLVFIGSAWDGYFRAFDLESGKELWRATLPAPGEATPMTYLCRSKGRQLVVIAAGGHGKLPIKLGDALVAFALP